MIKQVVASGLIAVFAVASEQCSTECNYDEIQNAETCECEAACPGFDPGMECIDQGANYETCECEAVVCEGTCPDGTFMSYEGCVCYTYDGYPYDPDAEEPDMRPWKLLEKLEKICKRNILTKICCNTNLLTILEKKCCLFDEKYVKKYVKTPF